MPDSAMQLDWPACDDKGLDRRTRRTRKALLNSLLVLLQEKPLSSITVTELTAMADVNRATFYTHYQDIFDMFDHLKNDLCETCRQMVNSRGDEIAQGEYGGLVYDIYAFLSQNEGLFSILFSEGSNSAFYTALIEVVREAAMCNVGVEESICKGVVSKGVPAAKAKRASQTICNYQFDYIAGGVVSILRNWMLHGQKESVEQMAAITDACIKSLNPDGKYSYSANSAIDFIQA